MVLRRRDPKIRLGKTMAQFEYQKKLDKMKLPRLEQEEFYRRYSLFDKTIFNRSSRSFNQNRTSTKPWAKALSTRDTMASTQKTGALGLMRTMSVFSEPEEIKRTFKTRTNKFILRSSSYNPVYNRVSQSMKTFNRYVHF
jgi:hypothetical protein